jgi:glycopeptide antibiotics resistance protein
MPSNKLKRKSFRHGSLIRRLNNQRLQEWLFLIWFFVIMVLSVIPDNTPDHFQIEGYEFRLDYLKHFFVFLPLGFLLLSLRRPGIFATILTGVLVVSIPEVIQYFLPYRTFNPMDLAFNAIGFIFGVFIRGYFNRKYKANAI